jgi:hypothetical protein
MMTGAANRIRRERAMAWDVAMLPLMKKPPSRAQYVGGDVKKEPPEFLEMRLRASVRGMRGITMAEYLQTRRKDPSA